MFLTIYMHQFEWLLERGGNFFNLLQKEGGTQKGGGLPQKRGVPTLEETMIRLKLFCFISRKKLRMEHFMYAKTKKNWENWGILYMKRVYSKIDKMFLASLVDLVYFPWTYSFSCFFSLLPFSFIFIHFNF